MAQVGKHHLKKFNMTVDEYKEHIVMPNTPLDMLGIFLLARLYRVHVRLILKDGLWSTCVVHDLWLCKFIMIYRGPHEYSETCIKGNSDL